MKLLILFFVFIALASNSLALKNEICGLPKSSTGSCRAHMRFWTYDSQANKCVFFIYGGCGRNGNSFNSEEACIANCVE
ncbi:male accessory gland serine protease inhibitor-like [Drosophila mauritiana]|uniref:Male accessory gland serine protease inhibitor-like n=1 Tax=Drosophila mauritiana TaxID=7226 RepID=A0A6P8LFX0_DROMA|nr:male accessory gland serine protease inhibitor-like [Drosophila mauritiana]